MLTFGAGWCNIHLFAEMAELADAHGSGPCEGDFMQVQVLFPAPEKASIDLKPFLFP